MFKLKFLIVGLAVTIFNVQSAPTELTVQETEPEDALQSSAVPLPYQEMLFTEYRNSCIAMSGSEEGYLKTVSSFEPAMACYAGAEGVTQFLVEFKQIDVTVKEERQRVIEKHIPALNKSLECLDDIIEGAAMCSGDDMNIAKQIYSKMLLNLFQLMWKDGGQIVFDFQKEEVKACIASIVSKADDCKLYDSVFKKPISQYGEVECRALQQSKMCLKQLADTCEGSSIMAVLNATYEPIEEATSCSENGNATTVEDNSI